MESILTQKTKFKYLNLANLTLFIVIIVILWGAFVRVTHSGAGCGKHWPLCDGEVIITDLHYEKIIEYLHRFTSGLSFILVSALFYTNRKKENSMFLRKTTFWSFFFISTEALIGAGLVLFGWVKDNSSVSRAFVVALHLINSFALIYNLTLCSLLSTYPNLNVTLDNYRKIFKQFFWLIVLFITVGSFGAITALGDTLFPSNSLVEGFWEDPSTASHFLVRLRILHPIFALVLSIKLLSLFSGFEFQSDIKNYPRFLLAIPTIGLVLVVTQVLIGVLNVVLLAPSYLQILHLFVSIILWMTFICFIFLSSFEQPN